MRKDMPGPDMHHAAMTDTAPPLPARPAPLAAADLLPRDRLLGVGAALVTIVIWASFIVVSRFGATHSLTVWDVAFLRYAPTTLLLAPLCVKSWPRLRQAGPLKLGLMAIGGGMPFLLVGMSGMQFAPAAHAGAMMPGAMPLFVALFAAVIFGERYPAVRLGGFALIVVGVLAIGGYQLFLLGTGYWRGHLLFLTAAALWAGYTLALKRAALPALPAIAFIYVLGGALYAPVYFLAMPAHLATAPWPEIVLQLVQGILSGVISLLTYSVAVTRLGPTKAAAFGALAPALAAVAAIPLLGEWPDTASWAGIPTIVLGVMLANGTFGGNKISNHKGG